MGSRTLTVRVSSSNRTEMIWPARTSREGLTGVPAIVMWPARQAAEASERVLNKRTAQSHLSIRTVEGLSLELAASTRQGEIIWEVENPGSRVIPTVASNSSE